MVVVHIACLTNVSLLAAVASPHDVGRLTCFTWPLTLHRYCHELLGANPLQTLIYTMFSTAPKLAAGVRRLAEAAEQDLNVMAMAAGFQGTGGIAANAGLLGGLMLRILQSVRTLARLGLPRSPPPHSTASVSSQVTERHRSNGRLRLSVLVTSMQEAGTHALSTVWKLNAWLDAAQGSFAVLRIKWRLDVRQRV